jgi:hypothetical protein
VADDPGLEVGVQPLVEVLQSVPEIAAAERTRVCDGERRAQLLPPRFVPLADRPEEPGQGRALEDDVLQLVQQGILVQIRPVERAPADRLQCFRHPCTDSAADEVLKSMLSM